MSGEQANDPDGVASQRVEVLAGWIRDRLRDMDRAQVPRIDQLCVQLQAEAFQWNDHALARAMLSLQSAGRELQFLPLKQGWVARLFGRHRPVHEQFIAAHDRVAACGAEMRAQLAHLAAHRTDHVSQPQRAVLELEAQLKSLEKAVDEGVTWLQDMCTQLATARAQGREKPQHAPLAEAAQSYTQRFKQLQSLDELAHGIGVRGNTVFMRRAALLDQVRADMEAFDKAWSPHVGRLVEQMKAGHPPRPHVPNALEAHDDLMKRLGASVDACGALQREEHLFAQQLKQLHREVGG